MQLGEQLLDFWTNICVCHSLISEAHPETGEPIFQVSSYTDLVSSDCNTQLPPLQGPGHTLCRSNTT